MAAGSSDNSASRMYHGTVPSKLAQKDSSLVQMVPIWMNTTYYNGNLEKSSSTPEQKAISPVRKAGECFTTTH